jgi:AraC family transcriptional regulator of adaptative response / DNA-3-methyladenine glycosylase II
VAQTRRVLLARQLIHETQLSMTEVAMASGFGSVRRFNDTFQRLFGRAPGALRRAQGRAVTGGAVVVSLSYRPPYDWPAILAFLRRHAIPGVESVSAHSYARTIALHGVGGMVVVEQGHGHTLRASISFAKLSLLPTIISRIRRLFDVAADPHAIAAHLSEDPALAHLVAARPGLRVPGAWDGFELAVRAVLGQQMTVSTATRLAGELVAHYGTPVTEAAARAAGLTHLFPPPERLVHTDLATRGLPPARAVALSSLAAATLADPLLFGPRRSLAEAIDTLGALPGVSAWTAQYIAMRELRDPDAFPAADVGLRRALAEAHGRRPTPAELLARAQRWRPWRAYAALHLWTALTPTAGVSHREGDVQMPIWK